MNKRIKELVKKSGLSIDKYGMVFANMDHNEGIDLDVFINLLIHECALSAENHSRSYSDGNYAVGCFGAGAAVRAVGKADHE